MPAEIVGRLRTRQFLPGGLLINGMEILRDCGVGIRADSPGMRIYRHALR
jgi:hypothetical protein